MVEKLICVNLHGGKNQLNKTKSPYELEEIYCSNCDNCPLYKKKKCIMLDEIDAGNCPYGRKVTTKDKSSRKKYYKYDETIRNALSNVGYFYGIIGDYAFIDIPYVKIGLDTKNDKLLISNEVKTFKDNENIKVLKGYFYIGSYIVVSNHYITKEFMENVINMRPKYPTSNKEVRIYQEKFVPALKSNILKFNPNLANELGIVEFDSINHVGLLGQVKSLKPNITFTFHSTETEEFECFWDGRYIITKSSNVIDKRLGEIFETYVKIIPDDNLYIKIEDNSWVTRKTLFKES